MKMQVFVIASRNSPEKVVGSKYYLTEEEVVKAWFEIPPKYRDSHRIYNAILDIRGVVKTQE